MSAFALRLAVLPSVLLLLFVVRRNKNSRDPMSLLVWLAVLGAVSTIPAVVVELVSWLGAYCYTTWDWNPERRFMSWSTASL